MALDPGIRTNAGAGRRRQLMVADTVYTPGVAIQLTASVAGEVVLTLQNGGTMICTLAVGDNIYPYAITTYASAGLTASLTRAYIIY